MPDPEFDVVVVGAGAAGLAALAELDKAGLRVVCLEARDRIGGRIHTVHDPLAPLPVELGAEFIHGRPPEIWQIVHSQALCVYDCVDASLHIRDGKVQAEQDAWEPVSDVMKDMREAAEHGPDMSFAEFLERSPHSASAKELSASFVEGFNAARREIIGIASLRKDGRAADEIDGDRSFRFSNGYDAVPWHLLQRVERGLAKLRLQSVARGIEWRAGAVIVHIASALTGEPDRISARRAVLTFPLGVLLGGSIAWDPAPVSSLAAASKLAVGQVMRVVMRFRESFWEEDSRFADIGFLLSNEAPFPTWWSTLAVRAPVLTGWSAGSHADALLGKPKDEIVRQAVTSLARILGKDPKSIAQMLETAYLHDWHSDPFALGAYSYVPAGALAARETLAEPVANALFFAGEATELNGHSGTVHGAIASGVRAARQILAAEGIS
jgi:monoamine oxidase